MRAWKAFGQWVNTIRKASPKSVIPEHALCAARKIVIFIQGGDTISKKVMEDLSSGMSWKQTDQSRRHERIRPPCDTGAEILGHRSSFVCTWSFAARLVTCERTRRMFGGQNVESSGFQVCASDNVLIASDGSGGSRETQIGETGRIWSGHLLVAATKRHILQVAACWFLGRRSGVTDVFKVKSHLEYVGHIWAKTWCSRRHLLTRTLVGS